MTPQLGSMVPAFTRCLSVQGWCQCCGCFSGCEVSSLRTSLRLAAPVRGNQHKGKSSAHMFSPFSSRVVFPSDNSQLPAFGLLARGTTWCDTQEYRLARREGPEGCSTMVGITPGEELEITVGEGNKDKKDTTQFLLTAGGLQIGLLFLGGNLKGTSCWNYPGWSHLPCSLGFITTVLWRLVPPACLS